MIAAIVDIIGGVIGLPVQTKHGLAQIVAGTPHVHIGGGQWSPIAEDSDGAWSYFRIIGQISVKDGSVDIPCGGMTVELVLRYCAMIPRDRCDNLPGYLVDTSAAIRTSSKSIRNNIKAESVAFSSIRSGIDEVVKQEFSNSPKVPLDKVFVNMDISISVSGKDTCLMSCNNE